MILSAIYKRKALWIAALLVALLVISGCSGIRPYEPRNNREEGPENGLFTGSEGEWVILRKAEEPEKDSEDKKSSEETKDNATKDDGQSQGSE